MAKFTSKFILIESTDAGGSSTQTNLLVKRLKKEKYTPHQFHFPQEDRATGRMIYDKFLLKHNEIPFSRREQALLYIQDFYSRAEDFKAILSKKNGKNVIISDRYYTSTMAYQTAGLSGKKRQEMLQWLTWLCCADTPALPKPDLVIFLDTPVEVSVARLADKQKDYHEQQDKLKMFHKSYAMLAAEQKWVTISNVDETGESKSKAAIGREVWEAVAKVL